MHCFDVLLARFFSTPIPAPQFPAGNLYSPSSGSLSVLLVLAGLLVPSLVACNKWDVLFANAQLFVLLIFALKSTCHEDQDHLRTCHEEHRPALAINTSLAYLLPSGFTCV